MCPCSAAIPWAGRSTRNLPYFGFSLLSHDTHSDKDQEDMEYFRFKSCFVNDNKARSDDEDEDDDESQD